MDNGYWEGYGGSGVNKNIVRERERWREGIRVSDSTCVG